MKAQEPELQEVGPRIMDLLSRRLQGAFMTVAERDPTNPELRRISALARQASALTG